jgi:IPT/TIG domain
VTWTKLHPAGSWGVATTDNRAADMPAVLALPGSWPIGLQPQALVRRDQWGALLAPPEVDAVTPNVGPVAGGTAVTVSGAGFTGATGVTFGGTAATGFAVTSDAVIGCTTPAHAAGAVAVVVQSPRGNVTLAGGFTYE